MNISKTARHNYGRAVTAPQTARSAPAFRTIAALVLREMASTYGRSPGGYLWALLQPVGALALFTVVIAVGLNIRHPAIGTNFMLFYATGFLPYAYFNETAQKLARALRFSRRLLNYPTVRFSDALFARFFLNSLTHFLVFYIVMTGIHIAFDLTSILHVPSILLSLALAGVLGLGVGTLNCFLSSMFPVWSQIWSVLTRPLFLLSTLIYTFEQVPWQYQDILWFNPLVHVVGLMRRGFFPTYDAPYVSVIYVFGVASCCLVIGLLLLNRYHRTILAR